MAMGNIPSISRETQKDESSEFSSNSSRRQVPTIPVVDTWKAESRSERLPISWRALYAEEVYEQEGLYQVCGISTAQSQNYNPAVSRWIVQYFRGRQSKL